MTMKSISYAAAVVAGLVLPAMALPGGALAQAPAATAPATASPAPHKAKAAAPKALSATERVEQHIARLHAQLQITPAQQPQWDQFAQVMRDNAKDMNQLMEQRAAGFATMNAVDNMTSYAQVAQQHAQDTRKLATAFQALYGVLSADQQKHADAVFRAHGQHPGHGKG